ncbi:uro-adherence factor A-like [Ambystoma mexicanum]|uniref:uro-adherence factor A-like n=1 Tax=Ambystoma mexicanum TaxID=8296 RepID=UPI0037E8A8AB
MEEDDGRRLRSSRKGTGGPRTGAAIERDEINRSTKKNDAPSEVTDASLISLIKTSYEHTGPRSVNLERNHKSAQTPITIVEITMNEETITSVQNHKHLETEESKEGKDGKKSASPQLGTPKQITPPTPGGGLECMHEESLEQSEGTDERPQNKDVEETPQSSSTNSGLSTVTFDLPSEDEDRAHRKNTQPAIEIESCEPYRQKEKKSEKQTHDQLSTKTHQQVRVLVHAANNEENLQESINGTEHAPPETNGEESAPSSERNMKKRNRDSCETTFGQSSLHKLTNQKNTKSNMHARSKVNRSIKNASLTTKERMSKSASIAKSKKTNTMRMLTDFFELQLLKKSRNYMEISDAEMLTAISENIPHAKQRRMDLTPEAGSPQADKTAVQRSTSTDSTVKDDKKTNANNENATGQMAKISPSMNIDEDTPNRKNAPYQDTIEGVYSTSFNTDQESATSDEQPTRSNNELKEPQKAIAVIAKTQEQENPPQTSVSEVSPLRAASSQSLSPRSTSHHATETKEPNKHLKTAELDMQGDKIKDRPQWIFPTEKIIQTEARGSHHPRTPRRSHSEFEHQSGRTSCPQTPNAVQEASSKKTDLQGIMSVITIALNPFCKLYETMNDAVKDQQVILAMLLTKIVYLEGYITAKRNHTNNKGTIESSSNDTIINRTETINETLSNQPSKSINTYQVGTQTETIIDLTVDRKAIDKEKTQQNSANNNEITNIKNNVTTKQQTPSVMLVLNQANANDKCETRLVTPSFGIFETTGRKDKPNNGPKTISTCTNKDVLKATANNQNIEKESNPSFETIAPAAASKRNTSSSTPTTTGENSNSESATNNKSKQIKNQNFKDKLNLTDPLTNLSTYSDEISDSPITPTTVNQKTEQTQSLKQKTTTTTEENHAKMLQECNFET